MKKRFFSLLMILAILFTMLTVTNFSSAATYSQLAAYWSPLIYQDVSTLWGGGVRTDFITNFDFDGDWVANNNWDNMPYYNENAYVYYSVQESNTHYFIWYCFFHPRDDGLISLDRHENDMEGILSVIKKDGTEYGAMIAMESQAHGDFYQYNVSGSGVTDGIENIDGTLLFDGSHPKVYSEAGGHAVYCYDGSSAPGGDGIVYRYTGTAQMPTNTSGSYTNEYGYALKSLNEFWDRRYDTGGAGHTFEVFGDIDGDDYEADSASTPWGWDDGDDGANFKGMMWSDPAYFIDHHLDGLGTFSHTYIYNPYYTHKITLNSVTALTKTEGWLMGTPDMYVCASVGTENYSDARNWKKNDVPMYTANNIVWGYDNAEEGWLFTEAINTVYVCRPHYSEVRIQVYDKDWDDSDDMGYLSATPSPGQTVTWTNANTSNGYASFTGSVYANAE